MPTALSYSWSAYQAHQHFHHSHFRLVYLRHCLDHRKHQQCVMLTCHKFCLCSGQSTWKASSTRSTTEQLTSLRNRKILWCTATSSRKVPLAPQFLLVNIACGTVLGLVSLRPLYRYLYSEWWSRFRSLTWTFSRRVLKRWATAVWAESSRTKD